MVVADVVLGLVIVAVVFDSVIEVLAVSEAVEDNLVIELVLAAFVVCGALDCDELLGQTACGPPPARNTVMMLVPSSFSLPQALWTLAVISSIACTHPSLHPVPPVKSDPWHPLMFDL